MVKLRVCVILNCNSTNYSLSSHTLKRASNLSQQGQSVTAQKHTTAQFACAVCVNFSMPQRENMREDHGRFSVDVIVSP